MKKTTLLTFIFGSLLNLTSKGQSDLKIDTTVVTYAQPLQIDSSDIFIIATQIERPNKTNKPDKNIAQYYNRSYNWTSVVFYNAKTKEYNSVFKKSVKLISAVTLETLMPQMKMSSFQSRFERRTSSATSEYVFFLVQTDYDKNGILEENEPIFLYIVSKNGTNLTQISPIGVNVISYTLSFDNKTLLLKGQKDSNKDKSFDNEDQMLYQINLAPDFSKITSFEIKLK